MTQQPPWPPTGPPVQQNWFARNKLLSIILGVIAVVLVCCCGLFAIGLGMDDTTDTTPTTSATKDATPEESPDKESPDKEKADKERADKEKADKEKADKEKADKEKADKEKADKKKADKKKADKKPKPRDELKADIKDRVDGAKVKFDGGQVTVTFPIGDNLTSGMIRTGAQIDTLDIIKAVKASDFQGGKPTLVVNGTFPMVDQYGNKSDDEILYALYFPEVLTKINPDNMLNENVWEVATEKSIHPELQE